MSKETFRISPNYTAKDWNALDRMNEAHWPHAVQMLRDRLCGRFLNFADLCLLNPHSGFAVLAIDCLIAETIQQFTEGIEYSKNPSATFKRFLGGRHFRPQFTPEPVRDAFYHDIRCGLLHQAEAKNMWLVRRNQKVLLQIKAPGGYILDVQRFHAATKRTFEDYLVDLCKRDPKGEELRAKLWAKMDRICSERFGRHALYGDDAAAASPTA